ncbi:pyridoxal phosphate-dependent decarboxylase family protein [Elongatibacter sediminis]|uniref:Aminotransferase class I/II-fold pyridoxal phosphate-dependent enzyme n=1 Tax=Elongatibacter sediminis TaxID=3119006 RepID=A0AAW9RF29_9GAMM
MTESSTLRHNPFAFDAETMRRLGYRVVDRVVERMLHAEDVRPVDPDKGLDDVAPLRRPMPDAPQNPEQVVEQAIDDIFGNTMNLMHPRFYAYMPAPGNLISALADFMASGFNVFAGITPHNHAAFEVERQTVDWLGGRFGWDFPSSGLFVSGGSAANLTALALARHHQLNDDMTGAVVYCSDQTHSSIERSMYVLGFQPDQLRLIKCDADLRLDPEALEQAVRTDLEAGLKPLCVVGNAGTTNTGAVDPLSELADVCERHDLWFHVDAAYGGGAVLTPQTRTLFAGIDRAHTIAVDPHKWLFQPFECAVILGREQSWFTDTFRVLPAYLRDTDVTGEVCNYRDMGAQLTRSFKALKLWLSLQVYGVDTFIAAVEHGLAIARYAEQRAAALPGFEVTTPATLGVLTCRWIGDADARPDDSELNRVNHRLAQALTRTGFTYVTTTDLGSRTVLRFCPIHPAATERDIDETFDRLQKLAVNPAVA